MVSAEYGESNEKFFVGCQEDPNGIACSIELTSNGFSGLGI